MTQKPNKKSHVSPDVSASTNDAWTARIGRPNGWLVAGVATTAALAVSAVFNRNSAQRAEAKAPPAGSFVDVDGVRLHYVERGSGPAVVLLHGNGVMLQDFEASGVLGLAAERHRVIAFDRPGFGYSDRPRSTVWTPAAQAGLIARALEQLGAEPAVIVGHSWGTLVALAMALEHPERVAGLVLISGYYYGTARPDVVPFSAPAVPVVGDLMAHTVSPLAGRLLAPAAVKASFSPAAVNPAFAHLSVEMMVRPSQVRATAADTAMMIPAAIALSPRYNGIDVPVIVLAGQGDLITHAGKHAERIVDDIPACELRLFPGQGHLLHYALPDKVVGAIDDVIKRAA